MNLTSLLPRFLRPTLPAAPGLTQQVRTMVSAKRRKAAAQTGDPRVRMVRYFLFHPAKHTPRPLRFGTMRNLRHWTIHRAWNLFRARERKAREEELERVYNKIREACEELGKTDARLYRIALAKKDVGTFPIELRIPTDTPSRTGWNHGWKRT
ncbi:mitochondrial ribosomal protein L28-domain-containing protein [Geopyxis carbonaria]|nr:mitochondrial ribosomal protein L28-domain-containing protein [Geopyxis carbonaria]